MWQAHGGQRHKTRQDGWILIRNVNPNSIGVKYSLIEFEGGGGGVHTVPLFDLLIGPKLNFVYFELKL